MKKFVKKFLKAGLIAFLLMFIILFAGIVTVYRTKADIQFYPRGIRDFLHDLSILANAQIWHYIPKEGGEIGQGRSVRLSFLEKLSVYTFSESLNGMFKEIRAIPKRAWCRLRLWNRFFLHIDFGYYLADPLPVRFNYKKNNLAMPFTGVFTYMTTSYDLIEGITNSIRDMHSIFEIRVYNYYDNSEFIGYGTKIYYRKYCMRTIHPPGPVSPQRHEFIPEIFSTSDLQDPDLNKVPALQNYKSFFILQNWRD